MKACTSLQNRETKIEDAANMIEKDLILLGATAVEDKLQEQVCSLVTVSLFYYIGWRCRCGKSYLKN